MNIPWRKRASLVLGIGVLLLGVARQLSAVITITEIMYHPQGDDRELEYVEIHNETPDPLDLTGYSFTAGVDFVFTERTFIDGGAYLVVCANKDKIQTKYGITNVAGNWSSSVSLDDSGEAVELSNPAGVVEARVRYNDRGKWPSGADGTGHSLELKYVYSEMDDPDMWDLSGKLGGSPGVANDTALGALPVVINEGAVNEGAGARWIELHNTGDTVLDVSGFHVTTDRANLAKATLAAGTTIPAHGWLQLTEPTLGLDLGGDVDQRVFVALVNAAGDRVLDARIFEANAGRSGKTEARIPDGDASFAPAADPTPGAANKVTVNTDIVINEVMYNPAPGAPGGEYIELYNKGGQPVTLTGWKITDGVNFDLPDGTTIQPDSYLVVAANPEALRAAHGLPALAVIGPNPADPDALDRFGSLADGGERITLSDQLGNVVDTVRYYDGGEWPRWADGGGSSMELIDARQDNGVAQAWDSSDESGKSVAQEYSYTGQLNGTFGAGDPAEFHIVIPGDGITVVDDLTMTSRVSTLVPEATYITLDDTWKLFKGQTEPSDPITAWRQPGFDDSTWTNAQAIIGFGEEDEKTILDDMRKFDPAPGYASFYLRKAFTVPDPAAVKSFVLDVEYDDGYVAYLNGTEVAVGNMKPGERAFNSLAATAKEKVKEQVDLSTFKNLLVAGTNILAVQVHNSTLASNDARWTATLRSGTFQIDDGPNLFKDGNFDADTWKSSWVIQGTHVRSGRSTVDPISGAGSLKVVSTGGGDNKVNRIETSNTGLAAPQARVDYHISFKARWITGAPTVLTHGSYIGSSPPSYASSTPLKIPANLGTPGAVNSVTLRQIAEEGGKNLGPVISKVSHTPSLPAANEVVTVRARVSDADGVKNVTLNWSLDTPKAEGDVALTQIPMLDADGDGVYTAEIPGQLAKKRVVFYVTAEDQLGKKGRWPLDHVHRTHPLVLDPDAAGPNDNNYGVYRADTPFNGKPQSFRFWMHQANEQYLSSRPLHSNDLVDGTFYFQNRDVYYNAKIRFSGSPWARQAWTESFRMRMPKDRPLHGSIEAFNMEDHQDGGARVAKERISHYLFRWHQGRTIVPYSLQWYVQLQVNDRVNEVRELVQTPNSELISRWWPGDDDGSFFEMDDRHVFNDAGLRQDSIDGVLMYPPYGPSALGADKEQYRYYFSTRLDEEQDDYSELVRFAKLLTASQTPNTEFDQTVWDQVDVESFLRYWSIRMNTDDWDCWGSNRGKNCYIYRPRLAGKWYLIPWDMELTYGSVGSFMPPTLTATSNPLYGNKFQEVARFINRPRVKRMYYGILKDLVDNQFQSTFLQPYLVKLDSVGAQQTTVGKPNGFIDQRRRSLQNAIKGVTAPAIDFAITTNGGAALEVESTTVTIAGKAPVEIRDVVLQVDGQDPKTAWNIQFSDTEVLGWSATGELPLGPHTLTFVGLNTDLLEVDSASISVTVSNPVPPAITSITPERAVVGEKVTIVGTRFKSGVKVFFGAVEATEVLFDFAADPTTVVATVPSGVALGPVQVHLENPSGSATDPRTIEIVASKLKFIRGDSDRSGTINLTDAIYTLRYLFQGGEEPGCVDAADVDDDGAVNLTDALFTVRYLFQGGGEPPAPFPGTGEDPTPGDALGCAFGLE